MKLRRKIAILLALLLLASLPLLSIAVADLGDFSGGSDFGGSSSSSDDCDGIGWLIYYGIRLGCVVADCAESSGVCTRGQVLAVEGGIVIVIIVALVLLRLRNKRDGENAERRLQEQLSKSSPTAPQQNFDSRIRTIDPEFSEDDLLEKQKNLYVRLCDCRRTKDLAPIRPYLDPDLLAKTEAELSSMRSARVTEHTGRLAILDAQLIGFMQSDGFDIITATLRTRCVRYWTNDETHALVAGNTVTELFETVTLRLVRPTGVKTAPRAEGMTVKNCPYCGAPLSLNESSQCPYCDSVLPADPDEWIIRSIERR